MILILPAINTTIFVMLYFSNVRNDHLPALEEIISMQLIVAQHASISFFTFQPPYS